MAPGDDPVRRAYARLAAGYDRRWAFYVEATVRETLRRIDVARGEKLLDVGCGTGALLDAASRAWPGVSLTGIDASPEMLGVARSKLETRADLREGRAEDLPFASEAFDVAVSSSVLHFVRRPEDALGEMARVLRPGGKVVITDWCHDYLACRVCDLFLRLVDRAHFRTYGLEDLESFLRRSAFEAVDIERYKISGLWGLMTARGRKRT